MRRTGFTSSRVAPLLALLALGCGAAEEDAGQPEVIAASALEAAADQILGASAESWNQGDLDGFISHYAADATFAGSSGLIQGSGAVRALYQRGYWASGEPSDALRFEVLHARGTGPGSGVVFGRYILEDRETREATSTGYFSLVLRRLDGAWKIVHDHSSAEAS
ncbi:MAG TPA: nuclear transport factor 2 family protein [Longimicrobiales bacterium]|nr:nuclear transport factor 2 family protein [Longimicrobiales bacterium]